MCDFDPKLNDTQTQECLKRLLCIYENHKDNKIDNQNNIHVRQAEFVGIYLLYNLGNTEAIQLGLNWKNVLR